MTYALIGACMRQDTDKNRTARADLVVVSPAANAVRDKRFSFEVSVCKIFSSAAGALRPS